MNEQFFDKMYELYLDMLQDTRADARTEERYNLFIQGILNNLRLNYNKDGLIIRSDESFINLFKTFEPELYQKKLKALMDLNEKNEEEE